MWNFKIDEMFCIFNFKTLGILFEHADFVNMLGVRARFCSFLSILIVSSKHASEYQTVLISFSLSLALSFNESFDITNQMAIFELFRSMWLKQMI